MGTAAVDAECRAQAIRTCEAPVEEVVATVADGRLMVHRLGDGGAPLCARRGVAVPTTAQPIGNAADQFFVSLPGDEER